MNTPGLTSIDSAKQPRLASLARLGRWSMRPLLIASGVAAVYFLSIGPAVLLNKHGVISPETLEKAYLPVSFLSEIPGTQWLLDHYLRLWVDPGPGHG